MSTSSEIKSDSQDKCGLNCWIKWESGLLFCNHNQLPIKQSGSELLGKFCGLNCWLKWESGLLFCDHNMRMCEKCFQLWFRFNEPPIHYYNKANDVCTSLPTAKDQETVQKYR